MKNYCAAVCLMGMAIIMAAGCASKENAREQFKPGSGLAEFRQITDRATQAIQDALSSLDAVAAQSNRVSPGALAALSDSVNRLQLESLQVRARVQAILERGDSYFERWHEILGKVKDSEVRALAEKNRPLLQDQFQQIKRSSREARAIFKPFLSGLRGLRNSLEQEPASLMTGANQQLLAATRNQGKQLLQQLFRLRDELDAMKALLTPPGRS